MDGEDLAHALRYAEEGWATALEHAKQSESDLQYQYLRAEAYKRENRILHEQLHSERQISLRLFENLQTKISGMHMLVDEFYSPAEADVEHVGAAAAGAEYTGSSLNAERLRADRLAESISTLAERLGALLHGRIPLDSELDGGDVTAHRAGKVESASHGYQGHRAGHAAQHVAVDGSSGGDLGAESENERHGRHGRHERHERHESHEGGSVQAGGGTDLGEGDASGPVDFDYDFDVAPSAPAPAPIRSDSHSHSHSHSEGQSQGETAIARQANLHDAKKRQRKTRKKRPS
jgi:hypothetical protein